MSESVMDYLSYTNKVREVCTRYFTPQKKLPNGQDNPEYHPGLLSDVRFAVEVVVSLASVFRALQTNNPDYMLNVVLSLSFGLTDNSFWQKFGVALVPVYKSALLGAGQAMVLRGIADPTEEQKELCSRQEKQWLNIPVMAYDCLYGTLSAAAVSPAMMQELDRI